MVIITGVSSGIGQALALHFLEKEEKVIGIGRTHSIQHSNFTFMKCDLQDIEAIKQLKFDFSSVSFLTLINNAGVVGAIERISQQLHSDIQEVITVNTIAPMLLTQMILKQFPLKQPLVLVNISSGAGKRAIPSWASYCASKAALDLFSLTIYEEEKELGRPIKVYAVSPGVVDTTMQTKIRSAHLPTFSSLETFIQLKDQNLLVSTSLVVEKLQQLLDQPFDEKVIYSLKD